MQPMLLSDEQEVYRKSIRRLCGDHVAPFAREVDESGAFPWKTYERLVEAGILGLGIPEQYGGTGADQVSQAITIEELARACGSTSLIMQISKLATIPILMWGSEDLKQRYLPGIVSGRFQAAYCLSEAEAGSDVAAMTTTARREGSEYVLSGNKAWVSNAGIAEVSVVFAKTEPGAGHRGISAFVVDNGPGVRVTRLYNKLGMRASPTGDVSFEEVRVPETNLLGNEGDGFRIAMSALDRSRPGIGAQAVGIAQGALDAALAYLNQRQAFGKRIADFQGLQFMVADAVMSIEAARGLVYAAHAMIDADHPDLTRMGAMAKCMASDVAMQVTTDAVQLFGGLGYTSEAPVERMMRDAKATQIYEGTNQIQRMVIARKALEGA